jgi:outer membrane cobalamin receptor
MTARVRVPSVSFRFLFTVAILPWIARTGVAQQPAPVSENVVVTATAVPEEEPGIGAATTVIPREQIEAGGYRTVAEVLRLVPGLDLVRSGGDGAVTFAELRGGNSTQTLVLVDGQRLNSPFFPGYDLSGLTTENVERIEIARGPFSALYGSDALGGVIQIFTRRPAPGFSGTATLEAGSAGQRGGWLYGGFGSGTFTGAAAYRDIRIEGDRPNSDWRARNGSARIEASAGELARLAVEAAVDDSRVGVPGPVGGETPHARYGTREERIALPVTLRPAEGHEMTVLVADVVGKPTFDDPDSQFSSETRARSLQARIADAWTSGSNRLTGFASWERGTVDDRSNFGVNLDGQHTTIWGAGLEDSVQVAARITVTAGVRYDRHSQFGRAWSPRATLAWVSAARLWKLRVSGGSAFRAPTVGELYYPFSGNPDLKPERSTAWEIGAERYLGSGRLEASLFWNDYRDLIVYDFSRLANFNVGRARTRGVEVAWREEVSRSVAVDAGYTYLDAKDLAVGEALIRRPRHRAFLSADLRPFDGLSFSPRAVFVGRRADRDALDGTAVEDPSYVRFDFFARYELARIAPFARVENLTDRRYEEVAGYPAPRRRWSAGIETKF